MPYKAEMIVTNNNLPLMQRLEPLMREALKKTLSEMGGIMEREAVLAIQNQTPPDGGAWQPLQAWYVEWKKKHGFSSQIYTMSSSLVNSITWKFEDTEKDMQLIVGVLRTSGPGQWGDTDIWRVAEILEYGWEQFNVKIPPRPLWRPLLEINRRRIQTRVGVAIYWSVKKLERLAKGKVEP